jgi:hypothetical protein
MGGARPWNSRKRRWKPGSETRWHQRLQTRPARTRARRAVGREPEQNLFDEIVALLGGGGGGRACPRAGLVRLEVYM